MRGARERAEVNLHAMTAGVAVLSLYAWLLELRAAARGREMFYLVNVVFDW